MTKELNQIINEALSYAKKNDLDDLANIIETTDQNASVDLFGGCKDKWDVLEVCAEIAKLDKLESEVY